MEVRHLEPIGLILDADVIKLNEDLGRFDVVTTVPLKRRAQSGFNLRLMCIETVISASGSGSFKPTHNARTVCTDVGYSSSFQTLNICSRSAL